MSDTKVLEDFLKRAHLRACGSNDVTGCGEECGYMKDAAFSELGSLTHRAEHQEQRNAVFAECLKRALEMWQEENPDDTYWPDGATNLTWVFNKLLNTERDLREAKRRIESLETYLDEMEP